MARILAVFAMILLNTVTNLALIWGKTQALRNFRPEYSQWLSGLNLFLLAGSALVVARLAWADRSPRRGAIDLFYLVLGGLTIPLWTSLRLLVMMEAQGRVAEALARALLQVGPFLLVTGAMGLLFHHKKEEG
jgi:predicted ferric reductase